MARLGLISSDMAWPYLDLISNLLDMTMFLACLGLALRDVTWRDVTWLGLHRPDLTWLDSSLRDVTWLDLDLTWRGLA